MQKFRTFGELHRYVRDILNKYPERKSTAIDTMYANEKALKNAQDRAATNLRNLAFDLEAFECLNIDELVRKLNIQGED